jgi:hypothetical protein
MMANHITDPVGDVVAAHCLLQAELYVPPAAAGRAQPKKVGTDWRDEQKAHKQRK